MVDYYMLRDSIFPITFSCMRSVLDLLFKTKNGGAYLLSEHEYWRILEGLRIKRRLVHHIASVFECVYEFVCVDQVHEEHFRPADLQKQNEEEPKTDRIGETAAGGVQERKECVGQNRDYNKK